MDDEKEDNKYPKVPEKYRIEYISRPTDDQKKEKQKSDKLRYRRGLKLWWHWKGRRFFYRCILIVGIIVLVVWYANSVEIKKFPLLEEPKTITFQWEYGDSKYLITEVFYKTVYDYYNLSPDKHCWQEERDYETCLKGFLEEAEEDNTISKIALDIKAVASKNGLRDDELLELTVAFVQSIPYDEDKFELVLYSNNPEDLYPRYPYEVLYDNEGICTDKTFLAASLIKELGYGVALFSYEAVTKDEVGHMVPAVKCSTEYSSYNSGYCYTEITERGFKIGELPPIDIDTKTPKARTAINLFEGEKKSEFSGLELGKAEIYEVADGNSYQGIIKTTQTLKRIETIEKELSRLTGIINSMEKEVKQLENSAIYYNQQAEAAYRRHELLRDYASYNEYSRLYSQYESANIKYESKLNDYNKKIDQYNNLAYEYNTLIEDFYK